ncbi:unnamed protein product [Penicillium salamii]|uniref:Uncharacterized protein n=1 Tax=Penicillium salamii TaxID=1612424 RepID=A0A9W4JG81_9EURO|nr:unnamed protein product [Penicillium salamii]CAG8139586.1 unnamed protein product [Penicillium salamii]CAG8144073.1 unnamed protein product [Penicillium salamii]CAG8161006.1 unnamed protein product [Penicillium salamii]CAG8167481.1 unnamed protein product [Penicillium salamii]
MSSIPLSSLFPTLSFLPSLSSFSVPTSPRFFTSLHHPPTMTLPLVHDTMNLIMDNPFLCLAIGLLLIFLLQWSSTPALKDVPTVKYHALLPDFLNRIFYYPNAIRMISEGYYKYKDRIFRMLTGDGEVYILPMKYQKDLRRLPLAKVSSLHAQYENALGDYTHILLNTELVSLTIRKRLTPNLNWVKINANTLFNRLIAVSASRLMVGDALRQNEEWLNAVITYAHSLGITLVLLRPVPKYLRPLVAPFLPPIWHMNKSVRLARRLFVPIIDERRRAAQENPAYTKPDDFLQWMLDLSEEMNECIPASDISTHMLLLVGLAVTHTSTMALCHAMFDLITKPEYLKPLREEIQRTLQDGWRKGTQAAFADQARLDSFLRESQRFGPPGDLSFHRIVMQPLTLHDGVVLPRGIHICFPAGAISMDPRYVSNPLAFDGFRWCKNPEDRYAMSPELVKSSPVDNEPEKNEDTASNTPASWVTVTETNMGFGYGLQTCPGRFFASNTTKIILSRLILDYDFKLVGDKLGERPANVFIGEHILPNLDAEILFRKKSLAF